MSKHAAGPWVAEYGVDAGAWSIEAGDFVLCTRYEWVSRAAESNANARLIAAAPSLLEALKAVCCQFVGVDHHRDECPGLLGDDGLTVLGPLCRDHMVAEMAEAAIAKATGGAP